MMSLWLLMLLAQADPGVVTGRIVYEGEARSRPIQTHVNTQVCGAGTSDDESLIVNADGGLKNAIVVVDHAPVPMAPTTMRLDQDKCTFTPHVSALPVGSTLVIGNADPIIHNVHARVSGRTTFNLAMPIQGLEVTRRVEVAGVHVISCDSGHTWMRAYVAAAPHPFFATTTADGRFEITGLPIGAHTLRIWHERLGLMKRVVEIGADHRADVVVTYRGEPPSDALTQLDDLFGVATSTAPTSRPDPVASSNGSGAALYRRHCQTCHGRKGDGRGPSRPYLDSTPRSFIEGTFKFRTTQSGRVPTIEDIYRTISLGVLGTDMPAFSKRLSSADRYELARFITTFSPRFRSAEPGHTITIPDAPPSTPETIARGRALYERLRCSQCHGTLGDGKDATSRAMLDDWGVPIAAADLTTGVFKGGRGPRVLYRTITTGLDGTPMPSFFGVLTDDERWALVHFIKSLENVSAAERYLLH